MTTKQSPSSLYLWKKRTLYIGPLFEPISLSQGAASLLISLDKPLDLKLDVDGLCARSNSILVPPNVNFTVDTGNAVVVDCMLDPLGQDYAALLGEMQTVGSGSNAISYNIRNESAYIRSFRDLYKGQYSSSETYKILDDLILPSERKLKLDFRIDPRIELIIDMIQQNISDNLSIESLAEHVNLSVPQLVHNFKVQTGVPIRRYRLWHRLYVTSELMGISGNLTTAAISAGFSDSSHFCHTFQNMLGMKPSSILSQPNQIRIITEECDEHASEFVGKMQNKL